MVGSSVIPACNAVKQFQDCSALVCKGGCPEAVILPRCSLRAVTLPRRFKFDQISGFMGAVPCPCHRVVLLPSVQTQRDQSDPIIRVHLTFLFWFPVETDTSLLTGCCQQGVVVCQQEWGGKTHGAVGQIV